ncbi:MAG: glycosyltransferase [Bacteroidota bacterium]
MAKRQSRKKQSPHPELLIESAWEVCNQVGGIYTVIRSKAPCIMETYTGHYCMVGPYVNKGIQAELEIIDPPSDVFGLAAANLRKRGYDVVDAVWLITGKPRVVLLNPNVVEEKALNVVKYLLWKNHSIAIPSSTENPLVSQVVAFGYLTRLFYEEVLKLIAPGQPVIGHFHEWMSGLPILDIKRDKLPVKTVFTTHATQLGRHLAINSPLFYAHLPFFDHSEEAKKFGVQTEEAIEYACAHACDSFTTVSDVTARECKHLLKRNPEAILPNGLNIQRFEVHHEFQNLHETYKERIHEFVIGHFFHSYPFDLDKTIYFFTSGRYEYKNKGFDLTLEALAHLNEQLKREKSDVTVIMFFVTKREYYNINPDDLHYRAMMEEIRQVCNEILKQAGRGLFHEATRRNDSQMPSLNDFVDEYWKLRYRRTIQSWKSNKLPATVTHKLVDEQQDEIVQFLTRRNIQNKADDKVKIIYHPDFITSTNPLFSLDYSQFVRGCHLGIFPSYYEPWGYTPLECMASGVPSVTSDLSGFGDYLLKHFPDHNKHGMYVVERGKRTFDWSARQLSGFLYQFLTQTRRERITQRNHVENYSAAFDWENLIVHYQNVYDNLVQPGN